MHTSSISNTQRVSAITVFVAVVLCVATPLSAQPVVRMLRTMKQDLAVVSVVFSPDGKTLITGSLGRVTTWKEGQEELLKYHTGGIQFWDATTGTLKKTITLHDLPVLSVAISPDGRTVATANLKEIRLWDIQTYRLKRVLHTKATQVVFSPDGKLLINATRKDGILDKQGYLQKGQVAVRLWDALSGKLLQTLIDKDVEPWQGSDEVTVKFLPHENIVAATDASVTRLWDVKTGKLKRVLEDVGERLTFSPDGQVVAALDARVIGPNYGVYQLALLDAQTWKQKEELTSSEEGGVGVSIENATSMAFSPDGKMLVAGVQAEVQEVRFWDVQTGKLQKQNTVKGRNDDNWTWALAFSPDGTRLARGGERTTTLWEIK